jgi:oligoendopeptidase F
MARKTTTFQRKINGMSVVQGELTHPKQLALWSLASATMFGLHSGWHSESSETCARLHFCLS